MRLIPDDVDVVTRYALEDNLYGTRAAVEAELKDDPLWEYGLADDAYYRRTAAFIARRTENAKFLADNKDAIEEAFARNVTDLAAHLPAQVDGPAAALLVMQKGVGDAQERRAFVYECVTSAGIQVVGCAVPRSETPAAAFAGWRDALLAYVRTHPGPRIFWRTRPEIAGEIDFETGKLGWSVYSRLAIPPADSGELAMESD